MAAHDLNMCGGTVVDGTRARGATAAVGVLVAPGYVDIQLHRRAFRQARPRPTARALLAP